MRSFRPTAPARIGLRRAGRLAPCSAPACPRTPCHTGLGIDNTSATAVTVNGTVQLGINNTQSLTINKTLNLNNARPSANDYTAVGLISFTVDTELKVRTCLRNWTNGKTC